MSKNMKGILGDQYGKVGPVVGRKFREENVYSAYQKNVFNPNTEKQQLQRMKFKAMSQLAHSFACGAIFGFRTAAKGTNRSARNLFQHINWDKIEATSTDSMRIDYTGIMVATGALSNVDFQSANFDTPRSVKVHFAEMGAPCQRTTGDRVFIYVFCPDAGQGILSEGVATNEGSIGVEVPALWVGLSVHVYGFVRNQGTAVEEFGIPAGECSDSRYIAKGDIG